MLKFSIIIVNWNVTSLVIKCLDSLVKTGFTSLELIVIDNASTDQNNLSSQLRNYPHLTVIKNSQNIGFPKAVNQGLKISSGDFAVILNPDTRVPKNFFSETTNFFNRYTDAGLMSPVFRNPDGSIQGSVFPEPSVVESIREFWLFQGPRTQKFSINGTVPARVNAVSGGCLVIPKSTLEKVGYFTESVFMYYEDLDYCRRLRRAGMSIYINPAIEIIHEHGRSSSQSPKSYKYLVASSKWYNGLIKYYILWFVSFTGQKLRSLFVLPPKSKP